MPISLPFRLVLGCLVSTQLEESCILSPQNQIQNQFSVPLIGNDTIISVCHSDYVVQFDMDGTLI